MRLDYVWIHFGWIHSKWWFWDLPAGFTSRCLHSSVFSRALRYQFESCSFEFWCFNFDCQSHLKSDFQTANIITSVRNGFCSQWLGGPQFVVLQFTAVWHNSEHRSVHSSRLLQRVQVSHHDGEFSCWEFTKFDCPSGAATLVDSVQRINSH